MNRTFFVCKIGVIHVVVFWFVTTSGIEGVYQRFSGTCIHLYVGHRKMILKWISKEQYEVVETIHLVQDTVQRQTKCPHKERQFFRASIETKER